MKNLKLSHFAIFIILLVALIISIYFAQWVPKTEGLIGFNENVKSLTEISVPPYTNTRSIYKLYDSVYYDPITGSILELFGTPFFGLVLPDQPHNDTTGTSLTNMVLMPRQGFDVIQYNVTDHTTHFSENTVETNYTNTSMSSCYVSWFYPNAKNLATLPYNYQVMYFPWKMDTVILVIDLHFNQIAGCYSFMAGASPVEIYHNKGSLFREYVKESTVGNNTLVPVLPQYSADVAKLSGNAIVHTDTLYQLSANVWFDMANGIVAIGGTSTNSDLMLMIQASFTLNSSTGRNAVITEDPVGNNIVLCVPFSKNRTMVCVLSVDPTDSNLLIISNVVRFDPAMKNGIDGKSASVGTKAPHKPHCDDDSDDDDKHHKPTSSPGNNQWMLKTQMVPPVCPACPACPCQTVPTGKPNVTVCPQCNTKVDASGNGLASLIANTYSISKTGDGDGDGDDRRGGGGGGRGGSRTSLGGVINNTLDDTANVADTAVGGVVKIGAEAAGLGADVVGDAADVVKSVAGDTTNVADTLINGIQSIVNNTVDKVTGIGSNMGSGSHAAAVAGGPDVRAREEGPQEPAREYETPTPTVPASTEAPMMTSPTPSVITPTVGKAGYVIGLGPGYNNFYGASNYKSSDFMPLTSDFSKFGR